MRIELQRGLHIALSFFLLVLMMPFVLGDVFINEFLADGPIEPDSEWIELFNNGSSSIDLTNYNITEQGASANFTLNTIIPANSFIVLVENFTLFNSTYPNVNASGIKIIEYGTVVASFQLSNTAGSITLYNSSGSKIDNISYSSTTQDVSIGRFPDGTSNIISLGAQTPGNKNDNDPPIFNKWVNPSVNNSIVNNQVNITVNITDSVYNVNASIVNFNNSNFSMSNDGDIWYFEWDTTLNVDGKYNITVFFNDTVGLSNIDTLLNVTVDNTPPQVTQFNGDIVNNANLSGTKIINASVTDITSSVDFVYFNITNSSGDNVANINASESVSGFWNASLNTINLNDGTYDITVYANDTVGNLNNSEKVTILIDNTNPSVIFVKPLDNENVSGDVNVTVNVIDITSGIQTVTVQNGTNGNFVSLSLLQGTVQDGNWSVILDAETWSFATTNLTINATDYAGNFNNSEFVTVNVANNPPVLSASIPNVIWPEDTVDSSINLSTFFTDDDGDTLTFNSTTPANISVSINQTTGIATLTPDANFNGINFINFSASDGINTTFSNEVTLNVTNVNDAPILTAIGSLTATQGILFFFDVNGSDPDTGDTLIFSSNSTLFIINSSTGEFNFTPTDAQVGNHSINISVNDTAGLQDNEIITLTVIDVNDAPVLDQINDINATEDSILEFNITATDIDGDSLNFTSNISSMIFTNAANNSLVTVSWIPTNDDVGDNTVNITASDGSLTDSIIFVIAVNNTNDAPNITSFFPTENKTIAVDFGIQEFNVTFTDIDVGDTLTTEWFIDGALIALDSTNVTITGLSKGIYDITFIVNDTFGESATNEWTLNVTDQILGDGLTSNVLDLNETERQSATNITVNRSNVGSIDFGNNVLNFNGVVNLEDAFNISNGIISVNTDAFPGLNKSASLVMKGLTFSKTPFIFIAPGFESTANSDSCPTTICSSVVYNATTGLLSFDVSHFTTFFTQTNTSNGPPTITSTHITTAAEGSLYSYDVGAIDLEGDTLIFSLTEKPSGMGISSSSGLISWTPTINQLGTNNVTVSVSDGTLSDTQSFQINVSRGPKLLISDLDVKIDGKNDKNILNNTKIRKEVKPGSNIEFKIEITNRFTIEENLEIEDIEVQVIIEDIDDGEDLEEESDDFDLDWGDDKTVKIRFKIPLEIEEGTYDVIIDVEGDDENGTNQDIKWVVKLEVEKENHDISIRKLNLNPTTLSCTRTATLNVGLINLGSEDEDEVILEIINPELEVNFRQELISLEEGTNDNTYEKVLTMIISKSQRAGVYPITVNSYHDDEKLDDSKTIDLIVQDCERFKEENEFVQEGYSEIVEVIRPPNVEEKKSGVIDITYPKNNGYFLLLTISFVLLSGLIVFMVGAAVVIVKRR